MHTTVESIFQHRTFLHLSGEEKLTAMLYLGCISGPGKVKIWDINWKSFFSDLLTRCCYDSNVYKNSHTKLSTILSTIYLVLLNMLIHMLAFYRQHPAIALLDMELYRHVFHYLQWFVSQILYWYGTSL